MAVTPFVLKGGQVFDTGEEQSELLYVAYFGRAAEPGPTGLNFWTEALEKGLPIFNAAAAFAQQQEAKDLYPFLANPAVSSQAVRESFINDIYQNLFNRNAEASGLAFWENTLEAIQNQFINGQITAEQLAIKVGEFVLTVAQGAQGSDAQSVANKVDVALYFTEQLIINNVPYDADAALVGHEVVDDTGSSAASVTAQKQVVDNFVEFGLGQTIDLTPETDIVNTSGADDTINGQVEQTAFLPLQTLNSSDKINTDGGRDVMNVQLVNFFTVPALLAGLEQINFTEAPGFITPNWELDVINADSLDTLTYSQLNNDTQVSNVKTLLSNVDINNYQGGNDIFIDLIGDASDGDADVLNLLVNNVGQGKGSIDLDIDTTSVAATAGYETLNIDSVGGVTNDIDVIGSAIQANTVNTIVITGDTDLQLNNNEDEAWDAADVDLIDASALNAGLTTWVLGTGAVEVRGGSGDDNLLFGDKVAATAFGNEGDDTFTFTEKDDGPDPDPSTFTKADFVDGGDGFDVLEIGADSGQLLTAGVGAGIVNIERIRHIGEFWDDGDVDGKISVNMAESGSAFELELAADYDFNSVLVTNLLNEDTVIVTGDHIGSSGGNTFELQHANPGLLTQEINLVLFGQADIEGDLVVASNVSVLNIDVQGNEGWNIEIDGANLIDTNILITGGGNDLEIGFDDGDYNWVNGIVDASQFTGNLSIRIGENSQTVTGGTGDDFIDVENPSSDGPDTINLGFGGADTVEFDNDTSGTEELGEGNYHQINGFLVGDDTVQLDVDDTDLDIQQTTGGDVEAGDIVSILNASAGGSFNGDLQTYNFIKFTTEVFSDVFPTPNDDAEELFDEAISGGNIYNLTDGSEYLAAMYDGSFGTMILFTVEATTNALPGDAIVAGNDVDVISVVSMTYDEFLAFGTNPTDLVFV